MIRTLDVPCPDCLAQPSKICTDSKGKYVDSFHRSRVLAALDKQNIEQKKAQAEENDRKNNK